MRRHLLSHLERKTLVEVYNEVKPAHGDKAMNRMSVFKWCDEFKIAVRLCMMFRGVED